jgi:hypothetical protein
MERLRLVKHVGFSYQDTALLTPQELGEVYLRAQKMIAEDDEAAKKRMEELKNQSL